MEYESRNSFEYQKTPEESGDKDTSKKRKKRTTKVPKTLLSGKEYKSPKDTGQTTEENVLEKLFEKTEKDKAETIKESDDQETNDKHDTHEEYDKNELAELAGADQPETGVEVENSNDFTDEEYKKTEVKTELQQDGAQANIPQAEVSSDVESYERVEQVPQSSPDAETEVIFDQTEKSSAENEPLIFSRHTAEGSTKNTEKVSPPRTVETVSTQQDTVELPNRPISYPEQEEIADEIVTEAVHRSDRLSPEASKVNIPKTSEQKPATEQAMNDRAHDAEKRGVRRGVLAGGIFGWYIGRRGKKEAVKSAKKAETEVKQLDKEIKNLQFEQNASKERISHMTRTQEYLEQAVKKSSDRQIKLPALSKEALAEPESVTDKKHELNNAKELSPENKEITEDTYRVKKGRRVETSAWHSIEVDEKTGKAVSDPERTYGEEFKHEQAQEKLRGQKSDPGLAVQFGHTAIESADKIDQSSAKKSQKSHTPNTSKRNFLSSGQSADIKRQVSKQATNPATWITAAVIFVMLIIFGALR